MAHLLSEAQKRGLRRIIVVLPFTNIIEQSVGTYRDALVLPGEEPADIVAELHHRAEFDNEEARHMTSLWRAPIIVTTAVAFFETLAANTPGALRRLHELPGSAIFVDESHAALPAILLPLAWKWMNIYAEEWGCYWTLASGSFCRFWAIPEIAQSIACQSVSDVVKPSLRERLGSYEENRVTYKHDLTPKTAEEMVDWVNTFPGPRLLIVNTVQSAAVLADTFAKRHGRDAVKHISTSLTSVDRSIALESVKDRLEDQNDTEWVLVATSCVEAGVDLSFRTGFRELSSLSSLLQSAGRVNREGKECSAEMWTFTLAESEVLKSNPALKNARAVLRKYLDDGLSISSALSTQAIAEEIKLYGVSRPYKEMIQAESELGFEKVKKKFKVIDDDTCLALVDPALVERVAEGRVNWRELQSNSVRIRGYRLRELNLPKVAEGIYYWHLGYDSFLGYMHGILKLSDPSNFII
jgi:CRISPR/Cas system-associated endonuclease/helicase Cas3